MAGEYFTRTFVREDDSEVTVELEVVSWGAPARTYGPPENCSPAEPMEFDFIGARDAEGNPVALTEDEIEKAISQAEEDPPEPDWPEPEPAWEEW